MGIPCSLTRGGRPVGLQIVGAIGACTLVLREPRLEQARPFGALHDRRTPPKVDDRRGLIRHARA
jgi:hypothetical protein